MKDEKWLVVLSWVLISLISVAVGVSTYGGVNGQAPAPQKRLLASGPG